LILIADTADQAQARFEAWLCTQPEGGNPVETEINRIVGAQFYEQLLTETGPAPIDWRQVAEQGCSDVDAIPVDDFEQGYWVDVNTVVSPGSNLDALRQNLPEDVSSGLNWSEAKQFFFLLSVLSPSSVPAPEPTAESETEAPDATQPMQDSPGVFTTGAGGESADFPEMANKEAAVLIRARNSVVAAWLWRKYFADTPLAANQIRIDPWCGVMGHDPTGDEPAA
jgi:hypothetical protein